MIYDNVLEALGYTPLVRLKRMVEPDMAQILVKYEAVNVGGSIKTRTAAMMIEEAEARGDIGPGSIIVEPTSGNQGIGLALICAVKGYEARIIMPDSVSEERRRLVEHYGATTIIVHDEGDIGAAIDECIRIAQEMAAEDPRVYVPQQFENIDNLRAHRNHTALEIAEDAGCHIHGFVSGIGTGGTISGIGQTLKRLYPDIEIWAVEPENAAILSGGGIGSHLQMGIGDGLIPGILDQKIYDDICVISDGEALQTARDLARKEGLMCGISSGTNVAAARRLAKKLGPGKTVVTVLPDTGERYFSTPLFQQADASVREDAVDAADAADVVDAAARSSASSTEKKR